MHEPHVNDVIAPLSNRSSNPLLADTVGENSSTHTKRRVCAYFLIYEVMFMCNFKHILPCLSHNFSTGTLETKYHITSFYLLSFLAMQLLTYKDVSVCKLSHVCNQFG